MELTLAMRSSVKDGEATWPRKIRAVSSRTRPRDWTKLGAPGWELELRSAYGAVGGFRAAGENGLEALYEHNLVVEKGLMLKCL